jgi:hypothetical protein
MKSELEPNLKNSTIKATSNQRGISALEQRKATVAPKSKQKTPFQPSAH